MYFYETTKDCETHSSSDDAKHLCEEISHGIWKNWDGCVDVKLPAACTISQIAFQHSRKSVPASHIQMKALYPHLRSEM
jgi:hypothetical protein